MGAKDGDKVVAEITDYGSRNRKPEGKITEVLGNLRSPGTDILAIVKSFTELQGGRFTVELDGDLFKSIITFYK